MIAHTTHFVNSVKEFHEKFELSSYSKLEEVPCETALLRARLIDEEYHEYLLAINRLEELDAICDLIYVVAGASYVCNVQIQPYTSNQLPIKGLKYKPDISYQVNPVMQDLYSRFPCHRIQQTWQNLLLQRLDDVGIIENFKLIPAFDEVHRSNMTKLWKEKPENPSYIAKQKGNLWLVKREDGKVIKSPDYSPANLEAFV